MNDFFKDLSAGLNQAIEIEKGILDGRKTVYEIEPVKNYEREQIKAIRNAAGMTQSTFASCMGVSVKTVEAWETGTNRPSGAACRLLEILNSKLAAALPFIKKKLQ